MKSLLQRGILLLVMAVCGRPLAAALDPAKPPSGNFDMTRWYLGLPVDSTGGFSGAPMVINTRTLSSGYEYIDPNDGRKKYFFTGSDGAMIFQVPWNGAAASSDPSKTGSPRSELRETLPDGTYYNWTPPSAGGTHALDAVCVVNSVGIGKVAIGQIHAKEPNNPTVILRYDNTTTPSRIYFSVYRSPDGGAGDFFYFDGVPLNTPITYQLKMVSTASSLVLHVTVNGVTKSVDMYANDPDWLAATFYFKAGAYYVTPQTGVTAQVSFYELSPNHASVPSITASPVSTSVPVGGTATFSVAATAQGNAPLRYQWYHDGEAIAGADGASCTIPQAVPADAGRYHVIVSNIAGASTSAAATLAVDVPVIAPAIVTAPAGATVAAGAAATFSVNATGTAPLAYQWYHDGNPVSGATSAVLTLPAVAAADAGGYYVVVSNAAGAVISSTAALAVTPVAVVPPPQLTNLSARSHVGAGDNLLIAGIVVESAAAKPVLLRAAGPELIPLKVTGVLADPHLAVFDASGAATDGNDDWDGSLAPTFRSVGAFDFPFGSKDAALQVLLPAGKTTAHVTGRTDTTGVALVEAYDLAPSTTSRLVNISARAFVGTGDNVLIAGFVVAGEGALPVLVRAVGPKLESQGVSGVLADPKLTIHNAGGAIIAENDNWNSSLAATFSAVGAFALDGGSTDAAVLLTLPAGAYTAIVTGAGQGTGVALIEVYEVR